MFVCCFLLAAETLGYAKPQEQEASTASLDTAKTDAEKLTPDTDKKTWVPQDLHDRSVDNPNVVGMPLIRNLWSDQKAIWSSPGKLRWADSSWLFPLAAVTGGLFATDRSAAKWLPSQPNHLQRYRTLSNYGVASLVGAGGGLYLWGKISHDDHRTETGILAGEAAINAVGVNTVLKYSFGRERPYLDGGRGAFFHGGTSFPSDHAAAAWSIASVVAHEYPGFLTKFLAYGVATGVSVSRIKGQEHFPSDVLVGSALGWFIGQYVYRAHHDSKLGGDSWETFSEARDSVPNRNLRNSGSPYVPLDNWIYPAIDRLAALGYVRSAFLDMRPWTRLECATLVQEAGEDLATHESASREADGLYATLRKEFQDELAVLEGEGSERSIRLESLYTNVTGISGQPLNDSDHFGQTIINDFGRPYQAGFNAYDGFSGYGTAGRYTIYVRGEFQHAPSGTAYSLAARQAIASADMNPMLPAAPVPALNQFTLLDTYVAGNVAGWEFSAGKQSLWWGPGVGGALMMSDNAEPIYMFRASPIEPFELPWILSWLGPMKTDFFFGKLSGNEFPPRPLVHGEKISFKRTQNLEMSFNITSEMGGVGRPLTLGAVFNSFFSVRSSDYYPPYNNPGKRTLGFDFVYKLPHLRNWLTLYADALLPEDNPTNLDMSQSPIYMFRRAAMRPGLYMPRLPRLPKLDFRVEAVYTDPPTPRSYDGRYIYWNDHYHNLYVNKNNLIGDWIGRQGMGFQGWSTYWFSSQSTVQFGYRHAKVDSNFIPGGETMNDGSVKVNWQLRRDLSLSTCVQYEKWFAPILAPAAQTNWTSSVQIQFSPHGWRW